VAVAAILGALSGAWPAASATAVAYDLSPVMADGRLSAVVYPNSRIVSGFWNDPDIVYLPYRRGTIFAYLADHALRRASGGRRNLDTVVFAMRDRWAAAGAARPAVVESFTEASVQAGFNPRPFLARNIDGGEPILLPADLFPGCVTVTTAEVPMFDAGFDRDKSAETGRITGVHPAGPAYAAGLRDGMRRIGRVGGKDGDSRVAVGYRVADGAGERVISYRPEGKTPLTLQEAAMTPSLSAAARTACIAAMSGGLEPMATE
jgi:predicted metalloprotease with PDZ domain